MATNTQIQTTQAQSSDGSGLTTAQTITQQAAIWDLSDEEYQRYLDLMEGPAKYDYAHLDPVMVLGIFARTESERTRLAELYAKQEFRRVQGLVLFDQAYTIAARKFYGHMPLIDTSRPNPWSNRKKKASPKNSSPLTAANEIEINTLRLQPGDRLALFVTPDCSGCVEFYQLARNKQSATPGVALDIYFMGNVTDDQIRAWASKSRIKPSLVQEKLITLNHDRGESKIYQVGNVPSIHVRFKEDSP